MRNLLAFGAAAALALVGVGWYLGWYSVQTSTNAKGNHQVNIDINDDKAKADVKNALKKGAEKVVDGIEKHPNSSTGNPGSAGSGNLELIPPPGPKQPGTNVPQFDVHWQNGTQPPGH